MYRLLPLVVVFATRPAHADDDAYWTVFGSLPERFGGCDRDGVTFVAGFRPELVVARVRPGSEVFVEGPGIGVYGQALKMGDDWQVGAGGTAVYYGGGFGAALSLGVTRFDGASHPAFSLFVGGRGLLPGYLDTPIGLRLDTVFGSASLTTVTFDIDVIGFVGLLVGGLSAALPHG